MRFFEQNRKNAGEAVRLENGGDSLAVVRVWLDVFGDMFPTDAVSFADRLKTVNLVGGAVTTEGLLTTAPGNLRPARPWRAVGVDGEVRTDYELPRWRQPEPFASPSMDDLLVHPSRVPDAVTSGAVVWGVRNVVSSERCDGYAVKLELTCCRCRTPQPKVSRVNVFGSWPRATAKCSCIPRAAWPHLAAPGRTWRHRNGAGTGALCLQYPEDDASLLWLWEDGLEELLTRVRIHLLAEEVFRRDGTWPGEELPHGWPEDGVLWPVASPAMRGALEKWAR